MGNTLKPDPGKRHDGFEAFGLLAGCLAIPSHVAAFFIAFLLTGAGHGWCSPFQVCWIGLFTGPLILFGWFGRRQGWGLALAFLTTAVLIAADYELVKWTMEDTSDFEKIWRLAPPFVIAWFLAWAYPQFVAIATPVIGLVERVYSRKKPSADESDEPYPAIKGLP